MMTFSKVFLTLSFIALFALLANSAAWAQTTSPDTGWQEDLDFFEKELEERHIDLFHKLDADDFHEEVEGLRRLGPSLSVHERRVALMRLARKIGDGHTAVPLWSDTIRRFPFEVTLVDELVLVTGVSATHKHLLGATLTHVNGVPVADVKRQLADVVPFVENDFSLRVRTGLYFLVEDMLAGIGLIFADQPTSLTFKNEGAVHSETVEAIDQVKFEDVLTHRLQPRHPEVHFTRQVSASDTLWFGESGDGKTLYIQLDRYPGQEEMQAFGDGLLALIRERGSHNLIIDLRHNFGGDFFSGLHLASILNLADSVNWSDGVYVLIGNRTFSAAMSNAAQFRQILNAKLVGSPTGGRPCGYQDLGQFELPHSQLTVTFSKRRFCFIDTADDSIYPDYMVKTAMSDFYGNTDSVLAWVMDDIARLDKADGLSR